MMAKKTGDIAASLRLTKVPATMRLAFTRAARTVDIPPLAHQLGFTDVAGSEDRQLRPATRLVLTGLSAWIVLVIFVTVASVISVELSTVNFSSWLGQQISLPSASAIKPVKNYEKIVERPLFSRSRQAAFVAPPPRELVPAPVERERNFILRGVYISKTMGRAFITSTQNPLGSWIQVNEEITGWKLVSIAGDQVVLGAQGETLTVPLSFGSDRK